MLKNYLRHWKILVRKSSIYFLFNLLSANPTKWSNTFKQFAGNLPTNCLSVSDHFLGLALKWLRWFMRVSGWTSKITRPNILIYLNGFQYFAAFFIPSEFSIPPLRYPNIQKNYMFKFNGKTSWKSSLLSLKLKEKTLEWHQWHKNKTKKLNKEALPSLLLTFNTIRTLTHFSPMSHFYTPETSENQRFSHVFRGYRNVTFD